MRRQFSLFMKEQPMKLLLGIMALVILVIPPAVLAKYPEHYTPAVETLLNAVTFALALWLGYDTALEQGRKMANDRWLPQAASACHRLQTVIASVTGSQCLRVKL